MKTHAMTDTGLVRTENQDCFYSSELPVGNLPNLFIVADGMGGTAGGSLASNKALETVVDFIKQSPLKEPKELFDSAIKKANEEVLKEAALKGLEGMGTTIVAASIDGDVLSVANVGDSRLYLRSSKELRQITKDHSLVEDLVRLGEIDAKEARTHEKKNVITRAVGGASEIDVDFFQLELPEEWSVLMCTDGLTNMVEDEVIDRILLTERDVIGRVEKLVLTAKNNGGRDNITVAVLEP